MWAINLKENGSFDLIDPELLFLYKDHYQNVIAITEEQYLDLCKKSNTNTKYDEHKKTFIFEELNSKNIKEIKDNFIKNLLLNIDEVAARIASKWLRFSEEYKAREASAMDYIKSGYKKKPSIYITSFSHAAKIDNETAADLILKQAEKLRHLQEELAAQRMRKFELKNKELTNEELQEIHDDIISKMHKLAGNEK